MESSRVPLELVERLRAGSRTVLYRPDCVELPVEFARRGFRLLLVHQDEDFLSRCRQRLSEDGLASQLMGCRLLPLGSEPNLARRFYDIVLFCRRPDVAPERVEPALEQQGLMIIPSEAGHRPASTAMKTLPAGFVAYHVNRR